MAGRVGVSEAVPTTDATRCRLRSLSSTRGNSALTVWHARYLEYPFHSDRSELILHVEADAPELNVIRAYFVSNRIAGAIVGGFVTAKLIPLFPILEFTEIRSA